MPLGLSASAPGVWRLPRSLGMGVRVQWMSEWVGLPPSQMRGSGGDKGLAIVMQPEDAVSPIERTWNPTRADPSLSGDTH
mgnify:CR=1 FL=1